VDEPSELQPPGGGPPADPPGDEADREQGACEAASDEPESPAAALPLGMCIQEVLAELAGRHHGEGIPARQRRTRQQSAGKRHTRRRRRGPWVQKG